MDRWTTELDQRAGAYGFVVKVRTDGMRATFTQTEMATGREVQRATFTGETSAMDAERAFMDAILPVIHQ